VLSTFLNELDGVAVDGESWASEGGLLVIVACIDIGCLDEALLRPGRLQYHIHLDYPTPADAEAVLHVCLRKLPLARVSPTDILKKMTYGRRVTPAEISGLCRRAVLNVIRDATGTDAGAKNSEIEGITFQHFEDALRSMYPELQTDMQTVAKDGCKDATMSPFTFGIGTKGSFL
jgi:transitional endoplasmic reticulum ATPase